MKLVIVLISASLGANAVVGNPASIVLSGGTTGPEPGTLGALFANFPNIERFRF